VACSSSEKATSGDGAYKLKLKKHQDITKTDF